MSEKSINFNKDIGNASIIGKYKNNAVHQFFNGDYINYFLTEEISSLSIVDELGIFI